MLSCSVAEKRCLTHGSRSIAVILVETLTPAMLPAISETGDLQLVVSANRAKVLGRHVGSGAAVLTLPASVSLQSIHELAGLCSLEQPLPDIDQWQTIPGRSFHRSIAPGSTGSFPAGAVVVLSPGRWRIGPQLQCR